MIVERRSTADAPPPSVTVTDPDGARQSLALHAAGPGRATASLAAAIPGVWQASDGTRTAFAAAAVDNPLEIADLRATATHMGRVVRASGGSTHFLDPAGAPELRRTEPGAEQSGYGWVGLRRNHDHLVTGIAAIPLMPPWLALPLLLGLVVIAWRQEGQ